MGKTPGPDVTSKAGPAGERRTFTARFNRAVILVGFVIYAVALVFAARRWDFPSLDWRAAGFLAVALAGEFGAKALFALLFADALKRQGQPVGFAASFRAALVGTAAARLLPAGGALTPTAMAWAVRSETDHTAGAALRTSVMSYGGLLLLTGMALGWGLTTGRHPLLFTGAVIASLILISAGTVILVGSRWLPRVVAILPERLQRHFGPTAGGGYITLREAILILLRVAAEATVLWAALAAFGIQLSPSQAMVAFGVSTVVGGIPMTPGGIGLVEGGLVGALAGFGFSAGTVVAPILIYRVIDYWIAGAAGIVAASRVTGMRPLRAAGAR